MHPALLITQYLNMEQQYYETNHCQLTGNT